MASQISLVEVTVIKYQANDKGSFDYLENEIELSLPDWKESISDLVENFHGVDIVFTQECYCFQFRFIGQSNDPHYSGGLEWIAHELWSEDVFGDWVKDFIQMFNEVMNEYKTIGIETYTNSAKFVTIWEYKSYQDYYGEYDDEWELLGRINMNRLKEILIGGD